MGVPHNGVISAMVRLMLMNEQDSAGSAIQRERPRQQQRAWWAGFQSIPDPHVPVNPACSTTHRAGIFQQIIMAHHSLTLTARADRLAEHTTSQNT